jgi:nucleotide-binding universal stress UspA family protein
MGLGSYIDVDRVKAEMRDAGNRLLELAAAKAAAAGCQSERILLESTERRVAELIIEQARQWEANLIVVGTHGRRGFKRMLVGSVAENLVRIAETSLLLVREQ